MDILLYFIRVMKYILMFQMKDGKPRREPINQLKFLGPEPAKNGDSLGFLDLEDKIYPYSHFCQSEV